jgi:ech hydrogenase subunit B
MAVLLVLTYMGEILIDNLVTRATWRWMLTYVWGVGIGLSFMNIALLYAEYF